MTRLIILFIAKLTILLIIKLIIPLMTKLKIALIKQKYGQPIKIIIITTK